MVVRPVNTIHIESNDSIGARNKSHNELIPDKNAVNGSMCSSLPPMSSPHDPEMGDGFCVNINISTIKEKRLVGQPDSPKSEIETRQTPKKS